MLKANSVKVIESFSFELKPKPQLSNPSESQMYMKSSQKNRQNKEPRLRSRPKFFSDHFSRPKLILIRFPDSNYTWSDFPDQKNPLIRLSRLSASPISLSGPLELWSDHLQEQICSIRRIN